MIVPVYNAELAPKALRGRLVSLNQLFITAGIMVIRLGVKYTQVYLNTNTNTSQWYELKYKYKYLLLSCI